MGVRTIFSRWGNSGFIQGKPKSYFHGGPSDEISFYPLETKKTTFFAKHLTGNVKFQTQGSS